MTAEIISAGAAILLALAFAYIPGLNVWYAALDDAKKRLLMLAMLVLVAAGSMGLACAGLLWDLFGIDLSCDKPGALILVRALLVAIWSNQSTYLLAPPAKAVREAKAKRNGSVDLALGRG